MHQNWNQPKGGNCLNKWPRTLLDGLLDQQRCHLLERKRIDQSSGHQERGQLVKATIRDEGKPAEEGQCVADVGEQAGHVQPVEGVGGGAVQEVLEDEAGGSFLQIRHH